MPRVDPVILQLRADIAEYNTRLTQAQRLTEQKLNAIEKSGERMGKQLKGAFSTATGAAGSFLSMAAAVAATRMFLGIADQAKQLTAQLKLATENFGDFGKAQADVLRISNETRTDLDATTKLYATFARSANDLGISQEQVARITTTVNESFKVSGAGASESADAIRQLVQAFQSGVLRGDEFNSVMENAPRLAKLMADSLGVPIGSLRQMAADGKLTSDKLVKALSDPRFTAELDRQFKQIPVTFDDAMVRVKNAAIETFGAFDRGGQFSTALANFVSDGANGFGSLSAAAEKFGQDTSATLAGVFQVFANLIGEVQRLKAALSGIPGIGGAANSALSDPTLLLGPLSGLGKVIQYSPAYQRAAQDRRNEIAMGSIKGSVSDWTRSNADNRARYAGTWAGPPRAGPAAISAAKGGGGRRAGGGAGVKSPLDPDAFAQAEARINEDILHAKVGESQTAQQKADFEMQRLATARDADIAEVNASTKYTAEQKAQLAGLIALRDATQVAKVVQERDNAIAKEAAAARAKAVEQQSNSAQIEIEALQAQADIADTAKERHETEKRILLLQQQEETARLEAMIAAGQIADAAKARANLEAKQAAERTGLGRSQQGPLAAYARDLNQQDIGTLVEQYAVDELQSVRDSLHNSISDFIGTKDPLINGLIDILIDQVIIRPLANALAKVKIGNTGGGGLFGAILGGIGSIFGGGGGSSKAALKARASGGYVAPGEMYRVNEGASPGRVEAFMPRDGGKIIPLGQMNSTVGGQQQQGGGIATVRLELSGDIDARIQQVSGPVAVQVVRASAPSIINASARETMARARRPKI